MSFLVPQLKIALRIFPYHIEFYIHQCAFFYGWKISMVVREWYDCYTEIILSHIESSQTDTINAYRTFFNDQRGELCIKFKRIFPASGNFFFARTNGGSIYMSLYDMSMKAVAGLH